MDISRLQKVFSNCPIGLLVCEPVYEQGGTPTDFVTRYINRAGAAILGAVPEALMGNRYYERLPDDGKALLKAIQRCAATGERQSLREFSRRIGRYLRLEISELGDRLFNCFIIDITQRETRTAETGEGKKTALTKSEEDFTGIIRRYAVYELERSMLSEKRDMLFFADPESLELLDVISAPVEGGMTYGNFQGRKCCELLCGESERCDSCYIGELRKDRYSVGIKRAGDVEFIYKAKLAELYGSTVMMSTLIDVTDTERKNKMLTETMQTSALFNECVGITSQNFPIEETFYEILSLLCDFFAADKGSAMLWHRINVTWTRQGVFNSPVFADELSDAALEYWSILMPPGSHIFIPDVSAGDIPAEFGKGWLANGFKSLYITPVFSDGSLVGCITLANIGRRFEQLHIMDMVAGTAARIAQNAELRKQNIELQYRDPLTGVLNLEGFRQRATSLIRENPDRKYSVWYCDIRRFKYINDMLGYDVGDNFLKYWVELARATLREDETLGRISADNITALIWYDQVSQLKRLFESTARLLESFEEISRHHLGAELIAGIYLLDEKDSECPDINKMLDRANIAQKTAKHGPGAHLEIYSEELRRRQLRELTITQTMQNGIDSGEFTVVYQPQYDYSIGAIIGAEALVRWNHHSLGAISPGEFVPIFERSGQVTTLDLFVWEQACRVIARIKSEMGIEVSISINISRIDLYMPDLCGTLLELVAKYSVPARLLKLEITESAYIETPTELIRVVARLRESGFVVEMDDFGSGYSSLNILKDVPVSVIKLDMMFLGDSRNPRRGDNILSSVVSMVHNLGLPVIAEGVETREQADYLQSLGCNFMQGYYFSRPIPEEELLWLLMADGSNSFPEAKAEI